MVTWTRVNVMEVVNKDQIEYILKIILVAFADGVDEV